MKKRILCLVLTIVVGAIAGCQKIEAPMGPPGGAPLDFSGATKSIPLEHGRLIGVTQLANPNRPLAVLWFERPDQTITGVRVNVSTGVIFSTVIVLPRK